MVQVLLVFAWILEFTAIFCTPMSVGMFIASICVRDQSKRQWFRTMARRLILPLLGFLVCDAFFGLLSIIDRSYG